MNDRSTLVHVVEHENSVLSMKALFPSEKLVYVYQTTGCHPIKPEFEYSTA
jgi:hypothetical protein